MNNIHGINLIKLFSTEFEPVGSRVTCNPPHMDTDIDYLILIETYDKCCELIQSLINIGYELGGSRPFDENFANDDDGFSSLTYGNINLIVTNTKVFYDRFMDATKQAKELNIMNKADRILLFQKVLYNNG